MLSITKNYNAAIISTTCLGKESSHPLLLFAKANRAVFPYSIHKCIDVLKRSIHLFKS